MRVSSVSSHSDCVRRSANLQLARNLRRAQCIVRSPTPCPARTHGCLEISRELLALLPKQFSSVDRTLRDRSEEHTSELQSHSDLVCRLLLEKKKNNNAIYAIEAPNVED